MTFSVRRAVAADVDTTTLVAERAGRLAGLGNVDLRPATPVIWKLYVHPEHQGTGNGGTHLARRLGGPTRSGPSSLPSPTPG